MNDFVLGFIVGYSADFIGSLLTIPIKKKLKKECNYDCSKCGVWDCEMHDCIKQKKKEKKK